MFRVAGVLFLAGGLILLGYTALSVARGMIWRSSNRYKTQPRWHPPRPVYRDAESGQFWLDVAWHALIAAAAIAMGVSWLRE